MKDTIPSTPFSTPLSRSAKETEMRLKNIFSGPKKRPPVLFLALMLSLCIFCGNLVSCNVAEAEEDPPSTSLPEEAGPAEGAGLAQLVLGGWQTVQLENSITASYSFDTPTGFLTEEQMELLGRLPVDELPREAVDPYQATRQDYWRDMLLPVAYDGAEDVSVYFVVSPGSMPGIGAEERPELYSLDRDGIVLRHGDRTAYLRLSWDINAKFGTAPLLAVDDFDGDGRPEAALSLAWGEGTGCYCECLYIFDLDTMMYTVPDYSDIPIEITYNSRKNAVRVDSGDQEMMLVLSELGRPFKKRVEVGNQIRFRCNDGQLLCQMDLDYSCDTLGYLSSVGLPVVYEDGKYCLGPAKWMNGFVI